jgi:hypothetical protein
LLERSGNPVEGGVGAKRKSRLAGLMHRGLKPKTIRELVVFHDLKVVAIIRKLMYAEASFCTPKNRKGESEDSPLQTFLRGWEPRVRIAPKALQQTLGNKKAIPRFPHST